MSACGVHVGITFLSVMPSFLCYGHGAVRQAILKGYRSFFSYFSMKTYVVTPHLNRLDETVQMMGHKICFCEEMWLIILKLSLLPLFIWNTGSNSVTGVGSS